jgi:hypothetical protein
MAKKGHRTTHRSVSGTKRYAVRDAKGRFKDIQLQRQEDSSWRSRRVRWP